MNRMERARNAIVYGLGLSAIASNIGIISMNSENFGTDPFVTVGSLALGIASCTIIPSAMSSFLRTEPDDEEEEQGNMVIVPVID